MKCTTCRQQMSTAEEASYRNRCETCWCLACTGTESADYRRISQMQVASVYLRPSEYKANRGKK